MSSVFLQLSVTQSSGSSSVAFEVAADAAANFVGGACVTLLFVIVTAVLSKRDREERSRALLESITVSIHTLRRYALSIQSTPTLAKSLIIPLATLSSVIRFTSKIAKAAGADGYLARVEGSAAQLIAACEAYVHETTGTAAALHSACARQEQLKNQIREFTDLFENDLTTLERLFSTPSKQQALYPPLKGSQ